MRMNRGLFRSLRIGIVAALALVVLLAALAGCGEDSDPVVAPTPTQDPEPTASATPTDSEPPETQVEVAPVSLDGPPLVARLGGADDPARLMPVPGLSGTAIDGSPFEWVPGSGPTVMVFLAHWCPACQGEVAELTAWLEEGNQLPAGVEFFGVSTLVDPERGNYPPSQWLADEGWPFPVLLDDMDSSVSTAFGLSGTPFWVFVAADGTLLDRGSGRIIPENLITSFNQMLS